MKNVPLTRLLLETDSPFLAPQSRRGERNEPAYIREVGEAMARIKNVTVEEVERVADRNARALFGVTAA
jgi:TatD DNase family protein